MASEPEVSEISSMFERMERNRDMSLFLPFVLGLDNASPRSHPRDPDEETESTPTTPRERIILINPLTQGLIVIEGTSSLETLLRELGTKHGQPPASKESIKAMPSVEIGEGEDGECAICLDEWEIFGGVAKEMPCKHKFHANCIEKWLGIHGSCPVCRYKMPVDEKETSKKRDEEGGERRMVERGIWVSFFNGGRRDGDSNEAPSSDSNEEPP
ncbi:E3 ubiquitin-protein ligase RING1-like [Quillaja saponaria]|uniref:RING-type E3 ubiquitin transferase n=1 Tax=Quillaja saponaria TaxID=32244 RepID=A0AAD7KP65_QUISA|nr:E3 ubiquitin-protein ligase RING1-like [Quillaja saponaria]